MQRSPTLSPAALTAQPVRRPIPLFIWLLLLVGGVCVLLLYLGLQRDLRLRRYAVDQAAYFVDALNAKVGQSKALPLNLELPMTEELRNRMLDVEFIPREDARLLRELVGPHIVGRSIPLPRVLASDGRVGIFFENGVFTARWLDESEYDRLAKEQRERVRALRGEGK